MLNCHTAIVVLGFMDSLSCVMPMLVAVELHVRFVRIYHDFLFNLNLKYKEA